MGSSVREQLLREISTLPVAKASTVLDFVRWLKAQAISDSELAARFDAALATATREGAARSITEGDVVAEIDAHRAGH